MHVLQNIRDFIDPDKMKFKVDSLQSRNVMTIHRMEPDAKGTHRMVMHIFTSTGTYIGTIENPVYIPIQQ